MISAIACVMLLSIFMMGLYVNPIMVVFCAQFYGTLLISLKLSKWIENKEFEKAFSERKLKVIKGLKLTILTFLYIALIPNFIKVVSSFIPFIEGLLV